MQFLYQSQACSVDLKMTERAMKQAARKPKAESTDWVAATLFEVTLWYVHDHRRCANEMAWRYRRLWVAALCGLLISFF